MDEVKRQRALAQRYGYLRSNGQIVVGDGPYSTILPVSPGFMVVPWWDPAIVFFPPRPGFVAVRVRRIRTVCSPARRLSGVLRSKAVPSHGNLTKTTGGVKLRRRFSPAAGFW